MYLGEKDKWMEECIDGIEDEMNRQKHGWMDKRKDE